MLHSFVVAVLAGVAFAKSEANGTNTYSVSGLSSGAFFTVQHFLAYSTEVLGVGVVAGGPYYW